jgi:IS5 family transposase
MTGKVGLFGAQENREQLSALVNPLEQLSRVVDVEMFRRLLEDWLINQNKRNNAGARTFDVVLMF